MKTVELNKEEVKNILKELILPEDYLKKEFPLKNNEHKVDYKFLWGNENRKYYRINFWVEKNDGRDSFSQFKDYCIERSCFVELTKNELDWEHKVIGKDN